MSGALRIRVRYQKYKSPWFDYLFVSPAEMEQLLDGTGWHVGTLLGADEPLYAAILTKTSTRPHVAHSKRPSA